MQNLSNPSDLPLPGSSVAAAAAATDGPAACGEPVTTRIEVYVAIDGGHHVLDGVRYFCSAHADGIIEALGWDTGDNRAVRTEVPESDRRCGSGMDFTSISPDTAELLHRLDRRLRDADDRELEAYKLGHADGFAEGLTRAIDPDSLPETEATKAAERRAKESNGLGHTLAVFKLGWKVGRGTRKTDFERAVKLAMQMIEERRADAELDALVAHLGGKPLSEMTADELTALADAAHAIGFAIVDERHAREAAA